MMNGFVDFMLSDCAALGLGFMALMLAISYMVWYFFAPKTRMFIKPVRRIAFATRAMNWGVFGIIFVLFSAITKSVGLDTWRATARLALFFLMSAELAYRFGSVGLLKEEISAWRRNT